MDLVSMWLKLSLRYPFLWAVFVGVLFIPIFWMIVDADSLEVPEWEQPMHPTNVEEVAKFDLKEHFKPFRLNFERVMEQLEWSSDPNRPDRTYEQKMLTLILKDSKEVRKIRPPCRLFIAYDQNGVLKTATGSELFWIDVADSWFRIGAKDSGGEVIESDLIPLVFLDSRIQPIQEIPESSPFRMLAEARWMGQDQFLPIIEPGIEAQRIEIGAKNRSELVDVKKSDWLIFNGESWEVGPLSQAKPNSAIARWAQKFGQGLELEGWEGDSYLRLRLELAPSSPLRKEDLFSQLKIRSEKQVSCTIDQQYLILKPGDWVLKIDQRWRVLRKRDEKDAFLNGKLVGDLFLLDRIEIKNGVKRIVGRLFGPLRTQVVSIDNKPQEPQLRSRKKSFRPKVIQERRSP